MENRQLIGIVMFRVDEGVVQDYEADLFRDPEDAKQLALMIIEECRLDDRYANPEHPHYDDQYAEETNEEYRKKIEDAEKFRSVSLHPDSDLVFLKVFEYVKESAK